MIYGHWDDLYLAYLQGDPEAQMVVDDMARRSREPDRDYYGYGLSWCLHKEPENEWDITWMCDQFRVFWRECNGIRTEGS
jgi:hypothetical protein